VTNSNTGTNVEKDWLRKGSIRGGEREVDVLGYKNYHRTRGHGRVQEEMRGRAERDEERLDPIWSGKGNPSTLDKRGQLKKDKVAKKKEEKEGSHDSEK